jgi:hypothetical protein
VNTLENYANKKFQQRNMEDKEKKIDTSQLSDTITKILKLTGRLTSKTEVQRKAPIKLETSRLCSTSTREEG